jgi:hypothetical protein
MKLEDTIFIGCLVVLAFTTVYAYLSVDNKRVIRYNCDIAEIHPDYPIEVKQKCRELNHENRTSK